MEKSFRGHLGYLVHEYLLPGEGVVWAGSRTVLITGCLPSNNCLFRLPAESWPQLKVAASRLCGTGDDDSSLRALSTSWLVHTGFGNSLDFLILMWWTWVLKCAGGFWENFTLLRRSYLFFSMLPNRNLTHGAAAIAVLLLAWEWNITYAKKGWVKTITKRLGWGSDELWPETSLLLWGNNFTVTVSHFEERYSFCGKYIDCKKYA
jgi:hypothetical protein